MIILDLIRSLASPSAMFTEGVLTWGSLFLCDTLEPKNRGLRAAMGADAIRRAKVAGSTAIPFGCYDVRLAHSNRFSARPFYKSLGGKLPLLVGVPGYSGVLIHCGNTVDDTRGCILVGRRVGHGIIGNSRATFKEILTGVFRQAEKRGERVMIRIQ